MAAPLWLPSFFASGMILQQQVPCVLRGRGRPSAKIQMTLERSTFDGRPVSPLDPNYGILSKQTADCDAEGRFEFELPAFEASFDPFTITITEGKTAICLENVLFGEVWIAGGQSNMHMPLEAILSTEQIVTLANLHYVRVFRQSDTGLAKASDKYGYLPAEDLCQAHWLRGDQPDAIAGVSAVGFSFAREVHLDLRIPVALIETALRGTQIHSWLSRESIESHAALKKHIEKIGFYRDQNDWNLTGDQEWTQNQPAALFNAKVAPFRQLGARGMIWYHGESDYQYPAFYQQALQTLVKDWSRIFQPADSRGLGFLYVQLTPYFNGHRRFDQLAEFNEMLSAVRRNLPCPAGLVTTYDLPLEFEKVKGDWRHPVHPAAKLPVGVRLKTLAMGLFYQRKAPQSAPECTDIEVVGNKMMLSFSNIGEGLRLIGEDTRLRGFAICGPDRVFVEAQARILYGLRVLVWHDQITDPRAVTYAYADMNQYANLISRDQLAVVPFRSDRVESKYCPPMEWTHCDSLETWCCPHFSDIGQTGWHPSWRIERGQGELKIEKANKSEGDGSLFFRYHGQGTNEFGLEPILQYDSDFPPLDLSGYTQISIDVFNTDQQIKHLRLAIAAGPQDAELQVQPTRVTILPALRWQRLQFDLKNIEIDRRALTRRLVFIIDDPKGKGVLYLDQIRLIRPD